MWTACYIFYGTRPLDRSLAVVGTSAWQERNRKSLFCWLLALHIVDRQPLAMSMNTRNTAFRKVDVDQFEEEKYEEEVLCDEGVTGPSDAEVQSLLSKYPSLR